MEKLNCIRIIRKSNQVVAAVYIKEFCKLCGFFTEDYEIEYENSIYLKERTGFLNLFFVSKDEFSGTGTKNLYVQIDEDLNLSTESLRKDFGQNIRKYIVQDIPKLLNWNTDWADDLTNLYDIFVSEDFAHHNYTEELFNSVIGINSYSKSYFTSKEQIDYYKNFSSLIYKYIYDNDDDTHVYKKCALIYCLKKVNIYARRASCSPIGNDLNMINKLHKMYRINPDLPNLLWSAFFCVRFNNPDNCTSKEANMILKDLVVSQSHKCEKHNLHEWIFLAKYYVKNCNYSSEASCSLGQEIFENILCINPKCYQVIWYQFTFHYNRFKHMYLKSNQKNGGSISHLRDELMKIYLLMLDDLKKGLLTNPMDLRIFYNCICLCKNSNILSDSDKEMIKVYNDQYVSPFEDAFKSLRIIKNFIFPNDGSFERCVYLLDPSNNSIKSYINEY